MINYMKSEYYRLFRLKGLYITSVICFLLIAAAAAVLYYFGQSDPNFPYNTGEFFYSNVIGSGLLIVLVGIIFNSTLTGKDMSLIKQSVSFGISRKIIFWSKLIITLSCFLAVCAVGILFMIVLGENMFPSDQQSVRHFLIASVNMAPLILSGFFLTHALKMMKVGDIYIIFVLLFIYGFSSNLLRNLFRPVTGLNEIYKYTPNTLLNDNLMHFMDGTVQFEYLYWIIGIVISVIAILIGAKRFKNQSID